MCVTHAPPPTYNVGGGKGNKHMEILFKYLDILFKYINDIL